MFIGILGQCGERHSNVQAFDVRDQTAVCRLIQALRKSGQKDEIADLLKRLAPLREQAAEKERQQYRFKVIGHREDRGWSRS